MTSRWRCDPPAAAAFRVGGCSPTARSLPRGTEIEQTISYRKDVALLEFRRERPDFRSKLPEFRLKLPEFRFKLPEFRLKLPEFWFKLPEFLCKLPEFQSDL